MNYFNDRQYENYLAGVVDAHWSDSMGSRDTIYQTYLSFHFNDGLTKEAAFEDTLLFFQGEKIELSEDELKQIILDNE